MGGCGTKQIPHEEVVDPGQLPISSERVKHLTGDTQRRVSVQTVASDPTKGASAGRRRSSVLGKPLAPTQGDNTLAVYQFQLERILGQGAFGKVRACVVKQTGMWFAMKAMSKKMIVEKKQLNAVKWELELLRDLNSPFIANLYWAFHDGSQCYLVMDLFLGGSLHYHITNHSAKLTETVVACLVADMCLGIAYLHSEMVMHRDIKPANVVVDSRGRTALVDLNVAFRLKTVGGRLKSRSGSPFYMAPEVTLREPYTFPIDWWSLGVTMYELLKKGNRPFVGGPGARGHDAIYASIQSTEPDLTGLGDKASQLIKKLLTKPEGSRGGYTDIRDSEWIKAFLPVPWDEWATKQHDSPYLPLTKKPDRRMSVHADTGAIAPQGQGFGEAESEVSPEVQAADWSIWNYAKLPISAKAEEHSRLSGQDSNSAYSLKEVEVRISTST